MNVYCYHRKFKKAATAAISSWENELKKKFSENTLYKGD